MTRFLHRLLASISLGAALFSAAPGCAAPKFLPPQEAFQFDARALDERTVEVRFTAADGYYLYGDRFAFDAAEPATQFGRVQLPAGKIKFDDTFGKDVETHRGRIVIRLPVTAAPTTFTLSVTSQGCADAGLCYPPQKNTAQVSLTGFAGDGSVVVQPARGPGLSAANVDAAQSRVDTATAETAAQPDTAVANRDQPSRIDRALRSGRWWVVVGVFFGAGMLLSLTPCMLPMLPILSSIIVGQVGTRQADSAPRAASRSRGLALALTYSLGMALVYTALGVAAGLAGEGLAATLQNPWVLGAFALLLAALSMSMFGVYELQLPAALRHRLDASARRTHGGRWAGVFAMGGISALIVSPCVAAPLAGALIYISHSRDVVLGGGALFSLAAGMSVPLILVGASAGALLPKAGAWMESVKRWFGVLLLAVAWYVVSPVLPAALVVAGWGVLALLAAAVLGAFGALNRRGQVSSLVHSAWPAKAAGWVFAIVGAVQLVGAAAGATNPLQPLLPFAQSRGITAGSATDPSLGNPLRFQRVRDIAELDAAIRAANRAGHTVMLDFYADWCVSCKEMEHLTFTDPRVVKHLTPVVLLQADVTRNNDADRALLKRYDLFGPPGILFFDAQGNELASQRVIGFQNAEVFLASLQRTGLR